MGVGSDAIASLCCVTMASVNPSPNTLTADCCCCCCRRLPAPPQVTLHEARDLPVWGFPWQSNPYCRITLGSQAVLVGGFRFGWGYGCGCEQGGGQGIAKRV